MNFPIIVVGAGAAGVGISILLKHLELPFIMIDSGMVGESFLRWPKETRFISPSFTSNAFGSVDLNAVSPDTSPAFSLQTEHPTGIEYASYLKTLADYYELPFAPNIYVEKIDKDTLGDKKFSLLTDRGIIKTDHIVWAAGEFQYANRDAFIGANFCTHYADIASWQDLTGDEFFVVGAYESGVDAAYQLAKMGKKVTLFDGGDQLEKYSSDSSYSLSPFTRDRFLSVADSVKVISAKITKIEKYESEYILTSSFGDEYSSFTKPINSTGFATSLVKLKHLFEFENNRIILNDFDESTICSNLFLIGPQVRHQEAIFCFIYKYRQRFGIVGEELSKRLNGDIELRHHIINYYKKNQFYLDDLSCCEDECAC